MSICRTCCGTGETDGTHVESCDEVDCLRCNDNEECPDCDGTGEVDSEDHEE